LKVCLHGVEFPLEFLYRGFLAVGQPGSGKTRCVLMPLIKEILRATGTNSAAKCALVIGDPKNELAPFIREAAAEVGREADVITLAPGSAYYNPLASPFLTSNEVVEKIISWAANTHRSSSQRSRGDEAFWANAQRSLLAALVSTARVIHDVVDFKALTETLAKINSYPGGLEASKWLRNYPVSEAARQGITDYLALPAKETRPCVNSSVANALHFWQHQPLANLTTPSASTDEIDPIDIIHRGKILVIGCAGAAFGTSITPLLLAIKDHFFAALLSRDQIDVHDDNQWSLINQTRPLFMVADEFQSYLSADPAVGELIALDRLRGFRAGYIGATQNLAALHSVLGDSAHAIRLISLFANQAFLSNICPITATQAEHILGKRKVKEKQREIRPRMAPPLLFSRNKHNLTRSKDSGMEVTRTEARVTATTLSAMRTGEFWLRLASGEVVHRQSTLFGAPKDF
jgi:type IV secretory pathway TraG/TraD family ATPase VirD4